MGKWRFRLSRLRKSGIDKKINSIRTQSNIEWIKNCISNTNSSLSVAELNKLFEDEILGHKISKSLMYNISDLTVE